MSGWGLRLSGCVLAGISLAWCIAAVAVKPTQADNVNGMGDRLARGDSFRSERLQAAADDVNGTIQTTCDARFLTSALFILLAAAEDARAAAAMQAFDERLAQVHLAARRTLSCAPTHAFSWLTLHWVLSVQNGYEPNLLRYLARSYHTGRYETWVAVRRNPIAMSLFTVLPPGLQEEAVSEFVMLVDTAQFSVAAQLFATLEPSVQQRILSELVRVPFGARRAFARRLTALGISVAVPGVASPDDPRHTSGP